MISKKKIDAIDRVSRVTDVLKRLYPEYRQPYGVWWDSPPDEWDKSEREMWDALYEMEDGIKQEIFTILGIAKTEDKNEH